MQTTTRPTKMKYTIEGFSQRVLVEHGLDATDAVLLRWFIDWFASGKMETVIEDGKEFAWINYDYVITVLPILGITTRKNIGRHLKKLTDSGILTSCMKKYYTGSKQYFRPGKNYIALIEGRTDARAEADKHVGEEPQDKNVPCPEDKNVPSPQDKNVPSYSSVKNSSSHYPSMGGGEFQEKSSEEELVSLIITTTGVGKHDGTIGKAREAILNGITSVCVAPFFAWLEEKYPGKKKMYLLTAMANADTLNEYREFSREDDFIITTNKLLQWPPEDPDIQKESERRARLTPEELAAESRPIKENSELWDKVKESIAV